MSATDQTEVKSSNFPKLPLHQINPSYTVRVICCVFFIFLTEIFLAHYIYRLINSEIRQDYVAKSSFNSFFRDEIKSQGFRDEVRRILKDFDVLQQNQTSGNFRQKRSVKQRLHSNYFEAQAEESQEGFFNSKGLLDEKNEEITINTNKGASQDEDSAILMTSSSRIPEKILEKYCKKIIELCPKVPGPEGPPGPKGDTGQPGLRGFPGIPGDMGNKGFPGEKGDKGRKGNTGDRGLKGDEGAKGIPGLMGFQGDKGSKGNTGDRGLKGDEGARGFGGIPGLPGEKGEQGRAGLDGRDGLPGEPGLYGRPGRNGYDGAPGKDGIPGIDGKDGVNGMKGERGAPGPMGPPGQRGLPGPRGRFGRPGTHGTPGIPGITAWKYLDKQNSSKFLIPPSIAGTQFGSTKIVHEGEHVRLLCSATGIPTPHITWRRMDKRPINRGAWQDIQVTGSTLNLTQINRDHMGTYMCIADNGVPPQANQTFSLEVYFSPLIRIYNQLVGVVNRSYAVLECETEAFPEPFRYWERSDGMLLEDGDKYKIGNTLEGNGYRWTMMLNITQVTQDDLNHKYYCISKNELQTIRGEFKINEIDPKSPPSSRIYVERDKETIFGVLPPDKVSLEDLCGPSVQNEIKCPPTPSGVSLVDLISRWEVRSFNENVTYGGVPNRSKDCVLYAVGKPVFLNTSAENYGCWMRDPTLSNEKEPKIWLTEENDPTVLYEFENKTVYRRNSPTKKIKLDHPFDGNNQVIYNGYFFYNVKDTRRIIRYHLQNQSTVSLDLPTGNRTSKLYSEQHNTVDFCTDDNGLWVIFAVPDSNNTAIMKVDIETMKAQYIWNISLDHHKVGEMFIVCGVLYAVDSVTDKNSKIRFAFDLYKNNLLDVNLSFSNPFRKTTMLGYNARNQELYSWDKGNQLTYPVRYHDIGYNVTAKEDKAESSEGLST